MIPGAGPSQTPRATRRSTTEKTVSESLKNQLRSDLNGARRARDKLRTLVLSTALAEVRNREIDTGESIDDKGVQAVLAKAIKQRKDAAAQMRGAGRAELAEKEEEEAKLLQAYLPPELEEEDVRRIIREIVAGGAGQIGAVMSRLMPRIRGRFDGKAASRIVREELE